MGEHLTREAESYSPGETGEYAGVIAVETTPKLFEEDGQPQGFFEVVPTSEVTPDGFAD